MHTANHLYDADDRARWVAEPPKRAGAEVGARGRDGFARDRARVLHSYAFRRLADKTQVVVPGEDDFPRTRLTHSLEVAQIAREIAAGLGCDPDLADAAGLAHDIGHPPFGHNGEQALNDVAVSCGGFEGNAQTLRVLTRLEPKVLHPGGAPAGLNLTRATLDAACKYPWPLGGDPRRDPRGDLRGDPLKDPGGDPGGERRAGSTKFGYYAADRAAFDWLRDAAPAGRRCIEAQVMDWADDVAYSVHDVEDGVHAGLVRLGELDDATGSTLCAIAAAQYSAQPAARLESLLESLLALPTLRDLATYDGSYAAQAAAKRATSELTGRLAGAAVLATRARYGLGPLTRYAADLVVPEDVAAECALLKAVAVHYVMRRPGTTDLQTRQRVLLAELCAALCDGAPGSLDPALAAAWHDAASDEDRLRVVIDQVAQLTDSSAVAWHARLVRPHRP